MAAEQCTTAFAAGIKITDGGPLMLPGHAVWVLRGVPVWMGRLGQSIEDTDHDEVVMHWTDIARIEGKVWYGR